MRIAHLCVLALLGSGIRVANAAPVAAPVVAEPLPVKDGLKVSIGSIELRPSDPHINVVLQNTSAKPIHIFNEWNSWGWTNLSLEIKTVNKNVFRKTVVVWREPVGWFANSLRFDTIEPSEAIVREVRFQMPVEPTVPEQNPVVAQQRGFYGGFPLLSQGSRHQLTMRAIFANDDISSSENRKSWTGHIASRWKDYDVSWNSN